VLETLEASAPMDLSGIGLPPWVQVRSAPGLLEPGVVGWRDPVLLMPADIDQHLTPPELQTIVAHELCHVRRRDNFTASLHMAAERLDGPLGVELRLTLQEQRMGLTPVQALENMVTRCPTPAVESFTRAMVQGSLLGVSIGAILRSLAVEMRKRRRAAVEQQAQKAPIKMLFPLVFMIFPAMFIVILGPAVISIFHALKG